MRREEMNIDLRFDNRLSKYVPREMYENAYRAWKQAAKKWFKIAEEIPSVMEFRLVQKKANRRLVLLRRVVEEGKGHYINYQEAFGIWVDAELLSEIEKELNDED
jgi:hypothetical protein